MMPSSGLRSPGRSPWTACHWHFWLYDEVEHVSVLQVIIREAFIISKHRASEYQPLSFHRNLCNARHLPSQIRNLRILLRYHNSMRGRVQHLHRQSQWGARSCSWRGLLSVHVFPLWIALPTKTKRQNMPKTDLSHSRAKRG